MPRTASVQIPDIWQIISLWKGDRSNQIFRLFPLEKQHLLPPMSSSRERPCPWLPWASRPLHLRCAVRKRRVRVRKRLSRGLFLYAGEYPHRRRKPPPRQPAMQRAAGDATATGGHALASSPRRALLSWEAVHSGVSQCPHLSWQESAQLRCPQLHVEPGRFEQGKDPNCQLEGVFLDSICHQGDTLPGTLLAPGPLSLHYKSPTNTIRI